MEKGSMKKHLSLPLLLLLVGCGGGGSSVGFLELDSTTPPTGVTSSPPIIKVWENVDKFQTIDGYVEGANVFVDWNNNGIQDSGEVSALWKGVVDPYNVCVTYTDGVCTQEQTLDPPDNYYYFVDRGVIPSSDDLTELGLTEQQWIDQEFPDGVEFVDDGINNFSLSCFSQAIKIADVPVGAYDSERGVVSDPYKMYYALNNSMDTNGFVNITPFSSLILNAVETSVVQSNACSSTWFDEMNSIINQIENLIFDLERNLDLNPNFFYEDFIASGDETKIKQAEKIVDHLVSVQSIENTIKNHYTLDTLAHYIGGNVLNEIISNPYFSTLMFDMNVEEGRSRFHFNDLIVNDTNNLLIDGIPVIMNIDNIKLATSMYAEQDVFKHENMELIQQTVSIRNGSERDVESSNYILYLTEQINEIQNGRLVYKFDNNSIRFMVEINSNNTLFPYDVNQIVLNEDVFGAEDLYDIIDSLPLSWAEIDSLISYLYTDDTLNLYKQTTDYEITFEYNGTPSCFVVDNGTNNLVYYESGNSSYDLCSQYF